MSITIDLEPEIEAWLQEQAAPEGRDLGQIAAAVLRVAKNAEEYSADTGNPKTDFDLALTSMQTRTPQQIAEARERVLTKSRRAKPLPDGKTLEDLVWRKWPGDETDEQIETELEALS